MRCPSLPPIHYPPSTRHPPCPQFASAENKRKVQRFMSIAEVAICDQYPHSAKQYLAQNYGLPIRPWTRAAGEKVGETLPKPRLDAH